MAAAETVGNAKRSDFVRELEPGETVFNQGDPGDQLFVIQSGEVELSREGESGKRMLARLGPGDFFGELAVVLGQPCDTQAVAVGRVRLLQLDRATLEAMCMDQPEIAIRMIRVLSSRLIEAERRLAVLGVDDLLRPVVRVLVRRATPLDPKPEMSAEDKVSVRIPLTLRGLAEEAGLTLIEAHRGLHQLFDRKVLDLVEDTLIASDLEALSACLD